MYHSHSWRAIVVASISYCLAARVAVNAKSAILVEHGGVQANLCTDLKQNVVYGNGLHQLKCTGFSDENRVWIKSCSQYSVSASCSCRTPSLWGDRVQLYDVRKAALCLMECVLTRLEVSIEKILVSNRSKRASQPEDRTGSRFGDRGTNKDGDCSHSEPRSSSVDDAWRIKDAYA